MRGMGFEAGWNGCLLEIKSVKTTLIAFTCIYLYRRYLTDACYAFKGWRTVQKNTAPKVKKSAECCGTPAFALNRCFSAVGTCSTAVEAKPTVKNHSLHFSLCDKCNQ